MLREIGLATPILIILTVIVVLAALSQTTDFGPLAGGVGVSPESALIWGETAEPMADATEAATPAAGEALATEESETEPVDSTPEPDAEATDEAAD
jgi:hypothetical protein